MQGSYSNRSVSSTVSVRIEPCSCTTATIDRRSVKLVQHVRLGVWARLADRREWTLEMLEQSGLGSETIILDLCSDVEVEERPHVPEAK